MGWGNSFFVFFNSKLYIQYLRQKCTKFKFKKSVLKLEISTFERLLYFLSFCEFDNFYILKTTSWKRFFSLRGSLTCPKKFTKIFVYLLWKLEAFLTKSFFKNIPMIFCSWVIRELSKGAFWPWLLITSIKKSAYRNLKNKF